MPGLSSWRFKNGMPLMFKVLTGLIVLNFLVEFVLLFLLSHIAHAIPDAAHSFMIIRGRNIFYVHPWLGRYLTTGAWFQFVLLGLLVLVLILNRSQLEKKTD